MTDTLNLVCAFKLDGSQTDMAECFGYSATQRHWVVTKATGRPGEIAWETAGFRDMAPFAPHPQDWYIPSSDGWQRTDVCDLVTRLALRVMDGPLPTIQGRELLRDQLLQDPNGIWFFCRYMVGTTMMYLTGETRDWVQYAHGQWSLPDQWPSPEIEDWDLFSGGSWSRSNVFAVIKHLADRGL